MWKLNLVEHRLDVVRVAWGLWWRAPKSCNSKQVSCENHGHIARWLEWRTADQQAAGSNLGVPSFQSDLFTCVAIFFACKGLHSKTNSVLRFLQACSFSRESKECASCAFLHLPGGCLLCTKIIGDSSVRALRFPEESVCAGIQQAVVFASHAKRLQNNDAPYMVLTAPWPNG